MADGSRRGRGYSRRDYAGRGPFAGDAYGFGRYASNFFGAPLYGYGYADDREGYGPAPRSYRGGFGYGGYGQSDVAPRFGTDFRSGDRYGPDLHSQVAAGGGAYGLGAAPYGGRGEERFRGYGDGRARHRTGDRDRGRQDRGRFEDGRDRNVPRSGSGGHGGFIGHGGRDQGYRGPGRHRGKGPRNYVRSDERIREDVNERLTDDPRLDASGIEVRVSEREVTLDGTVDARASKRLAEDIAETVPGVRHVQNNLRIRDRVHGE